MLVQLYSSCIYERKNLANNRFLVLYGRSNMSSNNSFKILLCFVLSVHSNTIHIVVMFVSIMIMMILLMSMIMMITVFNFWLSLTRNRNNSIYKLIFFQQKYEYSKWLVFFSFLFLENNKIRMYREKGMNRLREEKTIYYRCNRLSRAIFICHYFLLSSINHVLRKRRRTLFLNPSFSLSFLLLLLNFLFLFLRLNCKVKGKQVIFSRINTFNLIYLFELENQSIGKSFHIFFL